MSCEIFLPDKNAGAPLFVCWTSFPPEFCVMGVLPLAARGLRDVDGRKASVTYFAVLRLSARRFLLTLFFRPSAVHRSFWVRGQV